MSSFRSSLITAATLMTAAAFSQALAQPATTIALEIGAGPLQGSYEATSTDVTCSYGYAGEGQWGNQYSIDASDPTTFSSLQLIVDARAAAEGTDEFLTTVSFGPLFTESETSYTVNTRNEEDRGRGTVVLDDRGDTATVHISAVTEDEIPFEATIECHRVLRAGPSVAELEREAELDAMPVGPVSVSVAGNQFDFVAGAEEAYCEEAIAEDRDFQYTYYPTDPDAAITGVEVYLYDTNSLGADAPFYLSVYTQEDSYYVDTSEGMEEGSGRVTMQGGGTGRTVTVEATTADGVPIQVRLECQVE